MQPMVSRVRAFYKIFAGVLPKKRATESHQVDQALQLSCASLVNALTCGEKGGF
jgi:hypothetical protein